jgi:hypothetical protein
MLSGMEKPFLISQLRDIPEGFITPLAGLIKSIEDRILRISGADKAEIADGENRGEFR